MNKNEPITNAFSLGAPKALLLGLQHTFAMFGATVLVPILTGLNVSTTLLLTGIGTLLFHFVTKGKVPAFLGSSFAFLAGFAAVAPMIDGKPNAEMLPYACGGVVVAGLIYLILSGFITAFGVKKIMRYFPPIVTGPIIISIGLILAPVAISSASTNWLVALAAIIPVIVCSIWGKGMVKIVPIIIGVVVSYVVALAVGVVDFSPVTTAGIFGVAPLTMAKFDISAIIAIAPIALATMIEHIGDIAAISATTGNNYIANPGLNKTLLGDGLATGISGMLGGPANTTYGENTGVLALTKVYDPRVMQLAAVFAILLSFFPFVGAAIGTIPAATIGGISFMLYGMISAIGIRNLVENHIDFTKSRNLIIAAVILISALGFNATGGLSFAVGSATLTFGGIAIAAVMGILLNIILPGNDYEFDMQEPPQTNLTLEYAKIDEMQN